MRFYILPLFLLSILSTSMNAHYPAMAYSQDSRSDSVLYFKDGNDSIRIMFKENKIHKELTYYPDGKKRGETLHLKEKQKRSGILGS